MGELVLEAKYTGILTLGKWEIPCFVLNNEKRVMVQREVVYLLTGNKKGGLDRYTNAPGVKEFMPNKYVGTPHSEVVLKFMVGGRIAFGYEASDFLDICDAYLKARDNEKLFPSQYHLAKQAEIIIRASAKVGIVALIDEATGYQVVRDADTLQMKLEMFLEDELREWTKTFPDEFFRNLYRLEGIQGSARRVYPKRFGRYVMRFVYNTMDQDVANWLRKNNVNPSGKRHHFHWLTEEFGYPKLQRHLQSVVGIQKASISLENFKDNMARAFPEARVNRLKRLRQPKIGHKDQIELEFSYL